MLFTNNHSAFKTLHQPCSKPKADDILFCYQGNKIGLTANNELPIIADLIDIKQNTELYCFGRINKRKCFLWKENNHKFSLNFNEIRSCYSLLSLEHYHAIAVGSHIAHWRNNNIYCGKCSQPMADSLQERARVCQSCNNIVYPRISPCVIVLVTNGEKILLARSPYFPARVFSTLAGFIEPGESVEQAISREVKEEVGIEVSDIQYIASQPWPFPDSLMLGFTAQYVSGNICLDSNEIEAADWFDKDNLPTLPTQLSIARHLIEQHLRNG